MAASEEEFVEQLHAVLARLGVAEDPRIASVKTWLANQVLSEIVSQGYGEDLDAVIERVRASVSRFVDEHADEVVLNVVYRIKVEGSKVSNDRRQAGQSGAVKQAWTLTVNARGEIVRETMSKGSAMHIENGRNAMVAVERAMKRILVGLGSIGMDFVRMFLYGVAWLATTLGRGLAAGVNWIINALNWIPGINISTTWIENVRANLAHMSSVAAGGVEQAWWEMFDQMFDSRFDLCGGIVETGSGIWTALSETGSALREALRELCILVTDHYFHTGDDNGGEGPSNGGGGCAIL